MRGLIQQLRIVVGYMAPERQAVIRWEWLNDDRTVEVVARPLHSTVCSPDSRGLTPGGPFGACASLTRGGVMVLWSRGLCPQRP